MGTRGHPILSKPVLRIFRTEARHTLPHPGAGIITFRFFSVSDNRPTLDSFYRETVVFVEFWRYETLKALVCRLCDREREREREREICERACGGKLWPWPLSLLSSLGRCCYCCSAEQLLLWRISSPCTMILRTMVCPSACFQTPSSTTACQQTASSRWSSKNRAMRSFKSRSLASSSSSSSSSLSLSLSTAHDFSLRFEPFMFCSFAGRLNW